MLKRTISYEDFDGNAAEDTFYFNLTEAELIELESSYDDGFAAAMQRIIAANNNQKLVQEFKKLVLLAYGVRSEDGKRFIKSEELARDFSQHAAYSTIFMELATDAEKASEFINGIMPKSLQDKVAQQDKPLVPPAPPSTASSPSQ